MNILFLSYWGIKEGLTRATVLPHVNILYDLDTIDKVVLCTLERSHHSTHVFKQKKIIHIPLNTNTFSVSAFNKFNDVFFLKKKIIEISTSQKIDKIICRSSAAGILGSQVSRVLNIPFIVESFEPHAEYMLEAGEWTLYDPRYLFFKYWEGKQKQEAEHLVPVTNSYKAKLISEGISGKKIHVMPCCVDLKRFSFSTNDRVAIRQKLEISYDTRVGIYLGKFGGIYYDKKAFQLFKKTYDEFNGDFFLIILTPQDKNEIHKRLKKVGFPSKSVYIDKVPHDKVPCFLSAADLAFSPIKTSPNRKYCSAIKNGEYWANGLPILIPEGVGDDSNIIKSEGIGAVYNAEDVRSIFDSLKRIKLLLNDVTRDNLAKKIEKIAVRERDFSLVKSTYHKLFKD